MPAWRQRSRPPGRSPSARPTRRIPSASSAGHRGHPICRLDQPAAEEGGADSVIRRARCLTRLNRFRFVPAQTEGEGGANEILGTDVDLNRSLLDLIAAAGLTAEEIHEFGRLQRKHNRRYRSRTNWRFAVARSQRSSEPPVLGGGAADASRGSPLTAWLRGVGPD